MVPSCLEFRNLKAAVEVDGKGLPCHAVCIDKQEKNVSCWIASEAAKNFSVTLAKKKTPCSLRTDLYLDGKKTVYDLAGKREESTGKFGSTYTNNFQSKRRFMFAPLELTDDDAFLDASYLTNPNFNKIGEITVEMHRITHLKLHKKCKPKRKKRNQDQDEVNPTANIPEVQKVHEKSKKASIVPHQIAFGEEESLRPQQGCHIDEDDDESSDEDSGWTSYFICKDIKDLLATFTFRYRPLDVLVKIFIARSTPAPVTATSENPPLPVIRPQVFGDVPVDVRAREDVSFGRECLVARVASPHIPNLEILNDTAESSLANQMDSAAADVKYEDMDSDEGCSDFNEEIEALMAKAEQLKEEKRKRREQNQGPRKRVKREVDPLVFFAQGETNTVVDLT